MALSLESLLTNRRAKKTAPIRHFINNNLGRNSLNPQVNTNTDINDNPSNVTDNTSPHSSIVSHRKRSRRKTKPANIQQDNSSVINLSNSPLSTDEISVLSRGLTFCPTPRHINWPEVTADIYDFARRMRLTEYFFDDDRTNNPNVTEQDTPFCDNSTWNPPIDRTGKNCATCPYISDGLTSYTFFSTGETRTIKSNLTYDTKNSIYMIQCNRCILQYIRETKRRLKDRFNEHRRTIDNPNTKSKSTTAAEHFLSSPNHTANDMQLIPIENIFSNRDSIRKAKEAFFFILKGRTLVPHGLNIRKETY